MEERLSWPNHKIGGFMMSENRMEIEKATKIQTKLIGRPFIGSHLRI